MEETLHPTEKMEYHSFIMSELEKKVVCQNSKLVDITKTCTHLRHIYQGRKVKETAPVDEFSIMRPKLEWMYFEVVLN